MIHPPRLNDQDQPRRLRSGHVLQFKYIHEEMKTTAGNGRQAAMFVQTMIQRNFCRPDQAGLALLRRESREVALKNANEN